MWEVGGGRRKILNGGHDPVSCSERLERFTLSISMARPHAPSTRSIGLATDAISSVAVMGGGSQSAGILQTIADVFGAEAVVRRGNPNAAALGAALRAAHGVECADKGKVSPLRWLFKRGGGRGAWESTN